MRNLISHVYNRKREEKLIQKIRIVTVMAIFVTAIIIVAPVSSSADWTLRFGDNGWNAAGTEHVNFGQVEFYLPDLVANTGVMFADSGATNFTNSNGSSTRRWSTDTDASGSQYILATGPSVGALYWTLNFLGSAPAAFVLDYWIDGVGRNSSVLGTRLFVGNGVIDFNQGSGWISLEGTPSSFYGRSSNAPVPTAVLLLGTGLVGIAVLRKRVSR